MENPAIKRAIISVTDKTGLRELAQFLTRNNVEIISTGGTARFLEQAGIPVTPVSEVTNFPEILNGRVKTLHPAIHAGILANRADPLHIQTLVELDIAPFELVCVNLYDFSGAVDAKLSLHEAVEEIDIGGPCLLRAGAKNFHNVLVLPDPVWYEPAMQEMTRQEMRVSLEFRQLMASRAFEATSRYDALIASYLRP